MPLTSEIPEALSNDRGKRLYSFLRVIANPHLEKNMFSVESAVQFMSKFAFLSDDQIMKIKELDGIIGLVGVKPFCIKEKKFSKRNSKYQEAYIQHIKYIANLLGGVSNISVSTDDMTYYKTNKKYYNHFNVFKQENIKKELENLLLNNDFNKENVEKILHRNFEYKILQRL